MRILLILAILAITYAYIPVYVMMPLNTVNNDGSLNGNLPLDSWFSQLKSGGVDGIMCDVWWGIVERSGPKQYDWGAYRQLVAKAQQYGLKFQATISFHTCGGNVGDDCDILLPQWVRNVGNTNPDIYYSDQNGNRDTEYLSLGVDNAAIFQGRTPVEIYTDYVSSFVGNFSQYLGNTVIELQIGLGPAGELRYPSYQLSRWSFPGLGEFQCYDKYMLANLKQAATNSGHPEWGNAGPDNAGTYDCSPCTDSNCGPFFTNGYDNYNTPYGQFFLNWYSQQLIQHGDRILGSISKVVSGAPVKLAAKVAGIHWQYKTAAHSAELAAGYKNDQGNGYLPIFEMFAKYGVTLDFTCFEMRDSEQNTGCCGPEELVYQTLMNAKTANIAYQGENALPRYDQTAYNTILYESSRAYPISGFTYLRLGDTLMQSGNWNTFVGFVKSMHNIG